MLCQAADSACPHAADGCSYNRAVADIFAKNESTVSQARLALALRRIIVSGPSKETPVPFLVGPSNTGGATYVRAPHAYAAVSPTFHSHA